MSGRGVQVAHPAPPRERRRTTLADFATLDELKARLDWTLDADEERIATSALEDASDLARAYAGRDWIPVTTAPRLVRTLVLKACKRYMNNPSGYTQSRAGDETLGWNDDAGTDAGTVYFSGDEQRMLAEIGGRKAGLISAEISAWNSVRRPVHAGLVPVEGGDKQLPFFREDGEPW
ncbi:head-to-tail adaptor [Streptomyces phage Hank144]|uniref:Head-to-tail adaptor n=1 Tax=Streptomyces phage Hank144 TaxID=2301573 RepID=A0A385DQI4_9CAUD|nr:head-tail adaptor Ad1 [Streptomyces phage Hank144]AXQ61068.1 head-to-tail adaptor [Streptomyces phage Hank144]